MASRIGVALASGVAGTIFTVSASLGLTLTLPDTLLALADPEVQGFASYQFTNLSASGSSPWMAASPLSVEISEITLEFDDALPLVSVSPFTVDVGTVSVLAAIPFGISGTLEVSASKSPPVGVFVGGTRPINLLPDGSFRLDFNGDDVFQTINFVTPVGSTVGDGGAPWTFRFRVIDAGGSSPSIFVEFVGTGGAGGFIAGEIGGEPVEFEMQGPANFLNLGPIALVPEPGTGLLLGVGLGSLSLWRGRRTGRPSRLVGGLR